MRIGLIGCGIRSGVYFEELLKNHKDHYEFTAAADPSAIRASEFICKYGNSATKYFNSHKEMIETVSLDGVIVGSPNATHAEQAYDLYDKKIPFLLEKPVVTTLEDCSLLLKKSQESSTAAMVGFCLRYTPFYLKIKELVDSGIIGEILTINATEPITPSLMILYNRSWRRMIELAGPFLLEKCSHDMDIIRMIANSNAKELISFGARSYFNRKNQPATHCSICPEYDKCIYNSSYNSARINQYSKGHATDEYEGLLNKIGTIDGEHDICIFNDFEHPDHQTVSIMFENGVIANFLYVWGQCATNNGKNIGTGRTIQVSGSKGQIYGNIGEDQITAVYFENGTDPKRVTYEIKTDGSGHRGSDGPLLTTFMKMIKGEQFDNKATIEDGVQAVVISLAADISRKTGQKVVIEDLL